MDKEINSSSEFPVISGIFNVDEKKIPDKLIKKPEKSAPQKASDTPVMLGGKSRDEKLNEHRRQRREKIAQQKKQRRKKTVSTVIIILAAAVVISFAVKGLISNSKKPIVQLYKVTSGNVTQYYESDAAVITSASKGGAIETCAVIPENSYDLYSVQTGQTAVITGSSGTSYEARVVYITEESADTSLTDRLAEILPDKAFSEASNILVYVKPLSPMNEADSSRVSVKIVTAEERDVTYVPEECVFTDNTGKYVWVCSKLTKVTEKRYITVSLTANGFTAVPGGLKKNENVICKIITDTAEKPLSDGIKIRIDKSEFEEETTL